MGGTQLGTSKKKNPATAAPPFNPADKGGSPLIAWYLLPGIYVATTVKVIKCRADSNEQQKEKVGTSHHYTSIRNVADNFFVGLEK